MIRALTALALLWSAACSAAEPQTPSAAGVRAPDVSGAQPPVVQPITLDPSTPPPLASGTTASVRATTFGRLAASPPPASLTLSCAGAFAQGGTALCRTLPGARIIVDGADRGEADAQGWAVIGFDR